MKTIVNGLLQGRMARWGLLAAVVAVSSLCVASMSQRQYKFGGGWIGGDGAGSIWTALQIPKDPAGLTMGCRVHTTMYGETFAGLLSAFGADSATEAVGESEMISRDTAKSRFVFYLQKQGNPPTLCAIVVMPCTLTFTGPDNFFVDYSLIVYLPSADADKDGFPDPGAVPALTIPGGHDTAKRVSVW
jgi:hypothetical protein